MNLLLSCSKSLFSVSLTQRLLTDLSFSVLRIVDMEMKSLISLVKRQFFACQAVAALGLASAVFGEEQAIDFASIYPSPPMMELHAEMQGAMDRQDLWTVIDYAEALARYYPNNPLGQEAAFQCGETYFKMEQYELANEAFSKYLNLAGNLKHFEEVMHYKFTIAELFRNGLKMRLFDSHKFPRWAPSEEGAIALYDEIITTLPQDEIAAQSLWGKGKLHVVLEDFKDAIDAFQLLIRRFPKHDLAAQGYLEINETYLQQCKTEHLDLDLLDLAEMNFRKFQLAFPREARLEEAETALREMQQLYAKNLLDTGRYYEKVKKKPAAIIYYNKVVAKYPGTDAAREAQEKLEQLEAQNA